MKTLACTVLCLTALAATPAFGQDKNSTAPNSASESLTRFDLDFPGGSPSELVAAIEKSTGHALNAVVPEADANLKIPALRMKGVTVPGLFDALRLSSKTTQIAEGGKYYDSSYGFAPAQGAGRLTDDTVWVFYNDLPQNAKISRFFLLTPYLDHGLTVDDITTAVQTGWRMLGILPAPALSFHKETNLLIAVGNPTQIETIDQVLRALNPRTVGAATRPEAAKTER